MKVELIDHMGTDLSVVNAARVSFNKRSEWDEARFEDENGNTFWLTDLKESDEKLIDYLAKHEHFSPFNHTFITMHVKAPIFVARQLVKHEYMPWNEVSRRYVDEVPEFYEPEWRERPDKSIKQGSGKKIEGAIWGTQAYVNSMEAALGAYRQLLKDNVAPEIARSVLPQNMYTEWYWSGTLKAWAKMYNLRIDAHTQKETQEIARQAGELIEPLFPVSWPALTKNL